MYSFTHSPPESHVTTPHRKATLHSLHRKVTLPPPHRKVTLHTHFLNALLYAFPTVKPRYNLPIGKPRYSLPIGKSTMPRAANSDGKGHTKKCLSRLPASCSATRVTRTGQGTPTWATTPSGGPCCCLGASRDHMSRSPPSR